MDKLKISTAQFENKSGDKAYNLSVMHIYLKMPTLLHRRQKGEY